jgi:multidrug transporter EmrE-like cation transporter
MSFISYFDFNKRSPLTKISRNAALSELTDAVPEKPFDSASGKNTGEGGQFMPTREQIAIYFGIVAGVLFSSAAMQMKSGAPVSVNISAASILLSLVIAFVVLPVAYEKLAVNPASPLLVRIGLAVQHGVFWQVLLGSIGKMLG